MAFSINKMILHNRAPFEHIDCAKKLFNEISTTGVKYHNVSSYQNLLTIMRTL